MNYVISVLIPTSSETTFTDAMWNEQFWLPNNVTWQDFRELERQGTVMPRLQDLLYVYPLASVLYITRLAFEK